MIIILLLCALVLKIKEPYWVTYILSRIRKRKNMLLVITGATGSGKSWAGVSICEKLQPNFKSWQIVTSMKQLLELLNEPDKLKSGYCVLWDEAGIGLSSRDWQSVVNKLINFVLQTFRHRQIILILTCPFMDFLDANTRKLFHAEFQTMSIDYNKKITKIKPQLIQYNSRMKKFYYKYLRISTEMGVAPLKTWSISSPSTELIEEYEAIKTKFTAQLNKDILKQLDEIENKKKPQEKIELTELQEKAFILKAKYGDIKKVAEEMGLAESSTWRHLKSGKNKGWSVEDFAQTTPKNP